MRKFLAMWAVSCLAFISQPAFADDCDAKCRAALADGVDADVAKLVDKHDQIIIAYIKIILDTADVNQLGELMGMLKRDRRWRIKDPKHRALWYEIIYVALKYASMQDCISRSFCLSLYAGSQAKDKEFAERYNRAQYYLAARHDKKDAYKCTTQ